MNSQTGSKQRSEFLAGDMSADAIQKQFIDAPMAAAQQPAISIGLELLALMSALPDAFVASEHRELNRLSRAAGGKADPRIERLNASIERATEMRATAIQGKARIDRALASLSSEGHVFHGFISDGEAKPLSKLTVRIFTDQATDGSGKAGSSLSGTTDSDGYFSIPLGATTNQRKNPSAEPAPGTSSPRAAGVRDKINRPKASASAVAGAQGQAQATANVEILDAGGRQLYLDPFELTVDNGSAYREYVIENSEVANDRQRFAGNPATREFHDTQKLTKRCNFEAIDPNVRIYFDSAAAAEKAGYDYCAYCFGKMKSKR